MSEAKNKVLSVVVPFLDEEENLPILYDRLIRVMKDEPEELRIIFVDDGSTDGSTRWVADKIREDDRVSLVVLSRDFGHQVAITAGMDYADGDAVVIIDADLQDPPEVISQLLAKWREGYEVVYAVRDSRAGETWWKKTGAKWFYKVFRAAVKVDVPLNAGDFRLVDRTVIDSLRGIRELHRFMRGLTSWVGFRQCAVHYERAARGAGRSKYSQWQLFNLAWDAMTSFSGVPLRWVTGAGMMVSVLGALLAARIVIEKLINPETIVPGWATLATLILLLSGVQLVCLGVMGQYISRIFEESKKRPLYFVREVVGAAARKSPETSSP